MDKGLGRWKAMFRHPSRRERGSGHFLINLRVAPNYDIDLRSDLSTDWNARVLTLMARAGLIRLHGLPVTEDLEEQGGEFIEVEILDDHHLDAGIWQERVEAVRQRIARNNYQSLQLMLDFLRQDTCPADLFARLYQIEYEGRDYEMARVCGGCRRCQTGLDAARHPESVPVPPAPWPAGSLDGAVRGCLDHQGRLLVYYDPSLPAAEGGKLKGWQRRLTELLQALASQGLRKLIYVGETLLPPARLAQVHPVYPWFVARCANAGQLGVTGLPPGPEVILVAPGQPLATVNLAPRRQGEERIIILPLDMTDPERPGQLLRDAYGGAQLEFEQFENRVRL